LPLYPLFPLRVSPFIRLDTPLFFEESSWKLNVLSKRILSTLFAFGFLIVGKCEFISENDGFRNFQLKLPN